VNVGISLKEKNFDIQSIADLQGKSIATFQNAKDIFGPEFANMAEANPGYREYPRIDLMADAVITGKKDVYLADPYIFLHHLQTNYAGKMSADAFSFHRIFPEAVNPMGFTDPTVRDDFNQAVEQLKANGTYEAIYEKYQQLLGFTE
jgi:polar amino acid transport system substrate-binding protein